MLRGRGGPGRGFAWLGAVIALAGFSGCAEAPRAATPAAAKGPLSACDRAARQRSRLVGLVREGRLDRVVRVIASADELCPSTARESAALRVRTLAELGRVVEARRAIEAIEADASATPALRSAAAEARATLERRNPETGADLLRAAAEAKGRGDTGRAERLFERAAALLEIEAGATLVLDVPNGYGAVGGLPWAANGVDAGREARSGPPPLAFSPDGRALALADGARVSVVALPELRERVSLRGHGAEITGLAWSFDGSLLASGALDETARVWSPQTAKVTQTVKLGAPARGVWFAKQGAALACAVGHEITGWDLAKSAVVARFGAARSGRDLDAVSVAPNGIVTFAADGGMADVFSLIDRERLAGTGTPEAAAVAPDGGRVAIAEKRAIRIASAPKFAFDRAIDDAGATRRLVFSQDGALLASDDGEGTVRVFDARSGALVHAHATGGAEAFALTADGRLLVRGTRAVRVLDARTGIEVRDVPYADGRAPRMLSPDAAVLAGPGPGSPDSFELRDAATGRSLGVLGEPHAERIDSVAISGDGTLLAVASAGRARLVGLRTGDVTTLERSAVDVAHVRFTDGDRKLVGHGERAVAVWDVKEGKLLRDLDEEKSARRVHAVDARGEVAAVEDWEGFLWSWDVATDQSIHKLGPGPRPCDVGFAFSADGKLFACAKDDGTVRVVTPASGGAVATFSVGSTAPRRLAFLADGKTIAIAKADGTIAFFLAATGKEARPAVDTSLDGLELLLPSGPKLFALGHGATEGGAVRLYALASDVPARSWPNRLQGVADAALSGDGKVLAVAGTRQRSVGLWRVADAEPLAVLRVLDGGSAAYAMTPDGWIEVFGDASALEGRAVCRLGPRTLPFETCRDRFVTRGLVRGLLAETRAYRDP
jgi:WD40 repeat protein